MHVVIVGAGHGGGHLAISLARLDQELDITLIGEEPVLPYQRPPLSKAFLSGEMAENRLFLRPEAVYEKAGIKRHLGVSAKAINPQEKTVDLSSGETLAYDKLVLATGGRVYTIDIEGAHLEGVFSLRTLGDVNAMRPAFEAAETLVVLGGGYIGLEVAAVARKAGKTVHIVEREDRLLARPATPPVSAFFQKLQEEEGVHVHLGVQADALEGQGRVETVRLPDGQNLTADMVLMAVGISPNIELADQADIVCDNGILVNEFGLTSDPDVYAFGDCANMMNLSLGRFCRLESVQNAVDAGNVIAAHICGEDKPYMATPWFWSDQYDVKYQSVGLAQDYDEVVRRGIEQRSFSYFYLKDGYVIAVDAFNRVKDFMAAKKLVADKISLSATQISDEDFDLKSLF